MLLLNERGLEQAVVRSYLAGKLGQYGLLTSETRYKFAVDPTTDELSIMLHGLRFLDKMTLRVSSYHDTDRILYKLGELIDAHALKPPEVEMLDDSP